MWRGGVGCFALVGSLEWDACSIALAPDTLLCPLWHIHSNREGSSVIYRSIDSATVALCPLSFDSCFSRLPLVVVFVASHIAESTSLIEDNLFSP